MKRLLQLILVVSSVLVLSACQEQPFNEPPGTTMVVEDMIEFVYDNNQEKTTLFSYTFTQEYTFFKGPTGTTYHFKNINDYKAISSDFINMLEQFDIIQYDRFENTSYNQKDSTLRMSLGATEGNYNLVDVSVDDTVNDVDAYITLLNGTQIIFSYSEFKSNNVRIVIPYYLSITTHDIHKSIEKEYLGNENSYSEDAAVIVTYETLLVPFPPKSIVHETYSSEALLEQIDYFNRVLEDPTNTASSTITACDESTSTSCFNSEYSTLEGLVYDMSLEEVELFYETYYKARDLDHTMIIEHNGYQYQITLHEETIIEDDDELTIIEVDVTYYIEE